MKTNVLVCISLLTGASCLSGQSAPDMLEHALPGVVTIALNETDPASAVLGAASASRLASAYERVLDLSDAQSSGSGFLINASGQAFIVTNAHVIAAAAKPDEIYAYSVDQTKYRLRLFGGDSFYDIALLEFVEPAQPGPEMTPLQFRDSEIRVGESVFALGNPLGRYPYSVSNGIIGGKNRLLTGPTGRFGYLQHTATITWGNSGGPLVDLAGKAVGINTRIEITNNGQSFVHPQLNFALDGQVANRLIGELIAGKGRLVRPYLGLEFAQSIETVRSSKPPAEVVIASVVPAGPSAALEKFTGARVDRIGSVTIRSIDDAMAAVEGLKPDQDVALELTLKGVSSTVTVRTAEFSDAMRLQLVSHTLLKHLNMEVAASNDGILLRPSHIAAKPNAAAANRSVLRFQKLGAPSSNAAAVVSPSELLLLAVGIVPDAQSGSEPLLYRVSRPSDLASSLRILLMLGRVDLVVGAREWSEPRVSRWTPSEAANSIQRILIC